MLANDFNKPKEKAERYPMKWESFRQVRLSRQILNEIDKLLHQCVEFNLMKDVTGSKAANERSGAEETRSLRA